MIDFFSSSSFSICVSILPRSASIFPHSRSRNAAIVRWVESGGDITRIDFMSDHLVVHKSSTIPCPHAKNSSANCADLKTQLKYPGFISPRGFKTVLISETEPSSGDIPQEPRRSERLLITKSPLRTSLRSSPLLVFATSSSCGTTPFIVTDKGAKSLSLHF